MQELNGLDQQGTVALIAGGHTLGRSHKNCPKAAGAECKGRFTMTGPPPCTGTTDTVVDMHVRF